MHAATNEVPVHGWNQSSGEITRNLDEKSAVGKKQNGWKRMNKYRKVKGGSIKRKD